MCLWQSLLSVRLHAGRLNQAPCWVFTCQKSLFLMSHHVDFLWKPPWWYFQSYWCLNTKLVSIRGWRHTLNSPQNTLWFTVDHLCHCVCLQVVISRRQRQKFLILLFISCARQPVTCLTCLGLSEAPIGACPISYPSMPCHWQLSVSSGIPWDLLLTGLLLLLSCWSGA